MLIFIRAVRGNKLSDEIIHLLSLKFSSILFFFLHVCGLRLSSFPIFILFNFITFLTLFVWIYFLVLSIPWWCMHARIARHRNLYLMSYLNFSWFYLLFSFVYLIFLITFQIFFSFFRPLYFTLLMCSFLAPVTGFQLSSVCSSSQ